MNDHDEDEGGGCFYPGQQVSRRDASPDDEPMTIVSGPHWHDHDQGPFWSVDDPGPRGRMAADCYIPESALVAWEAGPC